MRWGRFERFALEGPDREWVAMLFWPQFIAQMALLIAAPIREFWTPLCLNVETAQSPKL